MFQINLVRRAALPPVSKAELAVVVRSPGEETPARRYGAGVKLSASYLHDSDARELDSREGRPCAGRHPLGDALKTIKLPNDVATDAETELSACACADGKDRAGASTSKRVLKVGWDVVSSLAVWLPLCQSRISKQLTVRPTATSTTSSLQRRERRLGLEKGSEGSDARRSESLSSPWCGVKNFTSQEPLPSPPSPAAPSPLVSTTTTTSAYGPEKIECERPFERR